MSVAKEKKIIINGWRGIHAQTCCTRTGGWGGCRGHLITHMLVGRGVPFTQSPRYWCSHQRKQAPVMWCCDIRNKLWHQGAQIFASSKPMPVPLGHVSELPCHGPCLQSSMSSGSKWPRAGAQRVCSSLLFWTETEGAQNIQNTLNTS